MFESYCQHWKEASFLFQTKTKIFSFYSYLTMETSSNGQIPSRDIHNPCGSWEQGHPYPIPTGLLLHLEGKTRNSLRLKQSF